MADSKRYTEREVAEILRIAGEQQSGSTSEGMTAADIRSLATDLGFDPSAIEAATAVVDAGSTEMKVDGTQFQYARSFPGELSDDAWEEIVSRMRHETGVAGTIDRRGATREWVGTSELRNTQLTATSKNGVTRFRISTDGGSGVFVTWILTAIPLLLGGAITAAVIKKGGEPSIALAVFLFVAGLSLIQAFRSISNRRKHSRSFQGVIDSFEQILAESAPAAQIAPTVSEPDQLQMRLNG